jgi:hypothetical protein
MFCEASGGAQLKHPCALPAACGERPSKHVIPPCPKHRLRVISGNWVAPACCVDPTPVRDPHNGARYDASSSDLAARDRQLAAQPQERASICNTGAEAEAANVAASL